MYVVMRCRDGWRGRKSGTLLFHIKTASQTSESLNIQQPTWNFQLTLESRLRLPCGSSFLGHSKLPAGCWIFDQFVHREDLARERNAWDFSPGIEDMSVADAGPRWGRGVPALAITHVAPVTCELREILITPDGTEPRPVRFWPGWILRKAGVQIQRQRRWHGQPTVQIQRIKLVLVLSQEPDVVVPENRITDGCAALCKIGDTTTGVADDHRPIRCVGQSRQLVPGILLAVACCVGGGREGLGYFSMPRNGETLFLVPLPSERFCDGRPRLHQSSRRRCARRLRFS